MLPSIQFRYRILLLWLAMFLGARAEPALSQTSDLSGQTPESIRAVITRVANHQLHSLTDGNYSPVYTLTAAMNATKPVGLEFDYPWGVNLYGLLRVNDVTGDFNLENFVLNHNLICGRYNSWLTGLRNTVTNANGTPANLTSFYSTTALSEFFLLDTPGSGRLDYCGSMTAQLLEGAMHHAAGPSADQILLAQKTSNYISHVQSRLPDGTLSRGNTVWADDLYMSCPFLVRWYQYTGDTNLLADAARQVANMAGYLQDASGLWFHGYFTNTSTVNGIKWGRANGWAMVTQTEVLSVMPPDHPARSNLLEILRRHIAGVEAVQQPSGMWRQILDYNSPTNWEETSCSAMFTFCIARAVNRGWIDPTNLMFAQKGYLGVCRNIRTNGVIVGTCQGTSLDTRISYYLGLSRPDDDLHGRGPVLLAGAELLSSQSAPPSALNLVPSNDQAMISWPVAMTNYTLETTSNLIDWAAFPGSPGNMNGQLVVTDSLMTAQFYRLRPPYNPDFEAELLSYPTYITNGATTTATADTQASGGAWLSFNAVAPGNYTEFTLPDVPAGSYQFALRYRGSNNRGQLGLQVDGTPLGSTLDQYRSSAAYVQTNVGSILFATKGSHVVRLTVTAKNAASSGYGLSADKFVLTPQ